MNDFERVILKRINTIVDNTMPLQQVLANLTLYILDHNLYGKMEIEYLANVVTHAIYGTTASPVIARSAIELLIVGGLTEEEIAGEVAKLL